MDLSHQDSLLEISESDRLTNMILSNNLTDIFQTDYYSKFKNSQNINEPSMTMSRVSQFDKISEDNSGITHIKAIRITERLASEINKSQLLENKVLAQGKTIRDLQEQLESRERKMLEILNENERLRKEVEKEKVSSTQYVKKVKELQFVINTLSAQLNLTDLKSDILQSSTECPSVRPSSQPRGKRGQNNSHSYTSSKAYFTKMLTEDSSLNTNDLNKGLLYGNFKPELLLQKDLHKKENRKQYRSQSNFWTSLTTSPNPTKSNHFQTNTSANKILTSEKKIENTISLLKAIKQQCSQFQTNKKPY